MTDARRVENCFVAGVNRFILEYRVLLSDTVGNFEGSRVERTPSILPLTLLAFRVSLLLAAHSIRSGVRIPHAAGCTQLLQVQLDELCTSLRNKGHAVWAWVAFDAKSKGLS